MISYKSQDDNILRFRMRQRFQEKLTRHDIEQKTRGLSESPKYTLFLAILAMFTLTYVVVIENEKCLPKPVLKENERLHPGRFVAERAMNHILNLTSFGPRPTGSFENEVLAINFLTKEINSLIKIANKVHHISLDVQKASGAFPLKFLDGMTSVYRNVQNVIAKISPPNPTPHSILMNCHFDTVPESPGGSDDSAGCAVMLEIFRIISQTDTPLLNSIVFLFNGAEENLLQASHGFITQHRWAKNVRAFVNLEACGAGGRELLFQAGPENPWLIKAYAESALYPLASSLAQEIFQSGLIPGETDYRIFRDFGNIPGLDFAWATNGYVYHTKFDNAAQIPLGSLQHTGDNILPLIMKLANDPNIDQHPVKGNLVFFDVLGFFMICMPEYVATILSILIILLSLYTVYLNFTTSLKSRDLSLSQYMQHLLISMASVILSWMLSLAVTAFIASLLSVLNRTMSWYSRPIWLAFLYVIPAVLIPLAVTSFFANKQKRGLHSTWNVFCVHMYGNQLIWTFILLTCVISGTRSGFIPAMWLLFSASFHYLKEKFAQHWNGVTWLKAYYSAMYIPFIQGCYIINGTLLIIVPIMGRTGAGNHNELVLGLISNAMFTLLLNVLIPPSVLINDIKKIISILTATLSVAILTLILTPYGFPYSSDHSAPALQRYTILHVERTFYGHNAEVTNHNGGFWVVDLDSHSPFSVSTLVPEMAYAQPVADCETFLFCGLPYMFPASSFIWKTHWIPYSPPAISVPTFLSLTEKEAKSNGIIRLSFIVSGPDHMNLMVSPFSEAKLISWSFVEGIPLVGPKWGNRDTYFVYYSCASSPEVWKFWMEFEIGGNQSDSIVNLSLGGHFLHGAHQNSVKLRKMLSHFPPWTVTTGWVATYKSYIF